MDESRYGDYSSNARDLARNLARAYDLGSGDARDFVSDASPWIGQERLSQAQNDAIDAQKKYSFYAVAGDHVRGIIRSINRDLAREAAAARARGASRVTGISRRLVELAVRLAIEPKRRRQYWSDLDQLARGARPRRAKLRYAVRALLRELRSLARSSS
ncbi:hypothetical protein [Actinomadura alba]|nr:hypothetical protein [Actinomadura alba]